MEETVGGRINRLRRMYGLTQKELARLAGTTEVSVSRYINNARVPYGATLWNLAEALHTTADYLMNGDDDDDEDIEVECFKIRQLIDRYCGLMSDEQRLSLIKAVTQAK